MKKNILSYIEKQWLRIWIALMTLSFFTFSVHAEYQPQSNVMKRVVVSASEPIYKFTSDVLSGGSISTYVPQYTEPLRQNANPNYYEVPVHIRNYSNKSSASWYDDNIAYNVSFVFTDRKGETINVTDGRTVRIYKGESLLFTLDADNNSSGNISQTLQRDSSHNSQDTYYLRFSPDWDLSADEDICVQMKAEPIRTGGKYNDLRNLGAIIGLMQSSGDTDSGWHAFLDEKNAVDENDPDYTVFDGYNLIITGSGKATITITWDPVYFDLNKYFFDNSNDRINSFTFGAGTDPETGETIDPPFYEIQRELNEIIINADSGSALTNHRTRYSIQVYNTGVATYNDLSFFAVNGEANYSNAKIQVTITQVS